MTTDVPVLQSRTDQHGWGVNRARRHNDGLRADGHLVRLLSSGHVRLDAYRSSTLNEHLIGAAMDNDACAMVIRILQIGLHG